MSDVAITSRICVSNGLLVGPKLRIPDDPRYFQTPGAKFVVGCNRFRCNLCGEMVRQHAGFRDIDADTAAKHARDIFDTPDFSTSQYLTPDADSRAYVCQCSLVILARGQSSPFPNGNWSCAGHPAVDGSAAVLPPITEKAANEFAFFIANCQLQQTINLLAFTLIDGNGMLAMPANISLGGGMPSLKIWTDEASVTPKDLDFSTVAGACVQLKDKSLSAF